MGNIGFDFQGRTAIVTGAGRGIGLELARLFATNGADTFLVDVDEDVVTAAAEDAGGAGVQANVADTADVQRVVDHAIETTGRVDVLVNNAGILRDRMLWKLSDEDWEAVLGVHLGGTFRFTRTAGALPSCWLHFSHVRPSSRVTHTSTRPMPEGPRDSTSYPMSKAR